MSENNKKHRTQAQRARNAKIDTLTVSLGIRSHVMIDTHTQKNHKLQAIWRGPMKVISLRFNLIFVVEDIVNLQQQVVHA